jgi:hypothetical protein
MLALAGAALGAAVSLPLVGAAHRAAPSPRATTGGLLVMALAPIVTLAMVAVALVIAAWSAPGWLGWAVAMLVFAAAPTGLLVLFVGARRTGLTKHGQSRVIGLACAAVVLAALGLAIELAMAPPLFSAAGVIIATVIAAAQVSLGRRLAHRRPEPNPDELVE